MTVYVVDADGGDLPGADKSVTAVARTQRTVCSGFCLAAQRATLPAHKNDGL